MFKKIKRIILSLLLLIGMLVPASLAKADSNLTSNLVNQALNQKTFYHYNVAYTAVINLPDGEEKNILLVKLASISNIVWSEDIKNINKVFEELVGTASGKIYDNIQITISNSPLPAVDKEYLMGEVTSWGKKLVWTTDYSQAMDALLNAWNKKDSGSVDAAHSVISQIKNQYSREYLLAELSTLKAILNEKPATQSKYPLLSSVPTIPNVDYTQFDLSEDEKIVHYYYSPDSLPANIMDTYGPIIESNDWIFDEMVNEADGLIFYFYKGEELLAVGFFDDVIIVYGTIH